jgi:serine/threonine protein kinase
VVGSGGFGITYEAEDISLGTTVALKEYYPDEFGDRDARMSVRPKSERHRKTFEWGRANFLKEARTLARFEHPSIVRVMCGRRPRCKRNLTWLLAVGCKSCVRPVVAVQDRWP